MFFFCCDMSSRATVTFDVLCVIKLRIIVSPAVLNFRWVGRLLADGTSIS